MTTAPLVETPVTTPETRSERASFFPSPQGRVGLGDVLFPSEERDGAGGRERLQAGRPGPGEPGERVDVLPSSSAGRERVHPQEQAGGLRNARPSLRTGRSGEGVSERPRSRPQVKHRADECILALEKLTQLNSGTPLNNVLQTQFDLSSLAVSSHHLCLFFFLCVRDPEAGKTNFPRLSSARIPWICVG